MSRKGTAGDCRPTTWDMLQPIEIVWLFVDRVRSRDRNVL